MENQSSNQSIEGPDITNYWQYFNLDRDPFAMNTEEALTYLPSYWEEMLDLIQYLVHYKNQLIVISGSNGVGKSVLADLMVTQLGESVHVAKIAAEPGLDVPRLIEFLGDSFIVPWKSEQSIEQSLDEQLQGFQHKEKNCLLVIDNAQLLPTETLEALLYLVGQQSESQMRFHAVLLGETALQQSLQRMLEPTEEGIVHFLTLEPLSLEETQQYLNHRLSAAGWQNEHPMSEEIVARIYRLSEGNPARINRIARRFLLDMLNDQEDSTVKTGSWWQRHLTKILGACLIVIVLILLGLWIWRANNLANPVAVHPESAPTISINGQPAAPAADQASAPAAAPVTAPAPTAAPTPVAAPSVDQTQQAPAPAPMPAPTQAPDAMPAPASAQQAPAPVSAPEPVAAPAQAPAPTPVPVPTPAAAAPAPAPAEMPAPVVAPTQVEAAAPAATQAATAVTAAPQPAAKATPAKPRGQYTIQLLNLSTQPNLTQFLKANNLQGKVRVETRNRNGVTTTKVYYGHYATMNEAEQAVATLPSVLMNAGPWPIKKGGK